MADSATVPLREVRTQPDGTGRKAKSASPSSRHGKPKPARMIRVTEIEPVANAVANARRKPGRYRNPAARRTYMAALMRRRRAERRAEREHDARLRAEIEQAAAAERCGACGGVIFAGFRYPCAYPCSSCLSNASISGH